MPRLALAVALALVLAGGTSARTSRGPIPWLPTRPPRVAEPALAPPCREDVLRGKLFLQGATGSLVGGVTVRNVGRVACSVLGRPHARLVGGNAGETMWRAKLV